MGKLDGKVVVVSGASNGIGLGTAKVLASEGAKVVMFARSDKMIEAERQMKELGADYLALRADATKNEDWQMVVEKAVEKYGKIDVLFTCAGGGIQRPLHESVFVEGVMTEEAWYEQFEQNFWTQFRGVRACLPELRKTKGNIIMIGSMTVERPQAPACGYACAKAAALNLASSLADQLGKEGIRVNAVIPGWIKSDLTAFFNLENDPLTAATKENIKRAVRIYEDADDPRGEPEDIGHTVAFLASDDAKYLTDVQIVVDGGYRFM